MLTIIITILWLPATLHLEFVLKCNFIQQIFSGMDINDLTLGSAKLYSTTSKTYTSFKLHIQSKIKSILTFTFNFVH